MAMLPDSIRRAIVEAANEAGVSPAFALAVAQRESSFNPNARASKTIRGLFQMTGNLRRQYGIGDSSDPYAQALGWTRFIGDTKKQMAGVLGRDPTDAEAYLGHHFGAKRAARMMKMDPNTPVNSVFTPYEMRLNPHFARAGTVGALNSSVIADIDRRSAKFGGDVGSSEPLDFAAFGDAAPDFLQAPASPKLASSAPSAPLDLSEFGEATDEPITTATAVKPAATAVVSSNERRSPNNAPSLTANGSPLDLSAFGDPVS